MRLIDRFKISFIFPLICGVIISILFTIIIMFVCANKLPYKDEYKEQIRIFEDDKNMPFIEISKSMMHKKMQRSIDILINLRDYYTNYSNLTTIPEKPDIDLIKNYSMNVHQNKTNNTDSNFFSQWFINLTVKNINDLPNDSLALKQLSLLVKMIPILNSLYVPNSNLIQVIYFGAKRSQLFFQYPDGKYIVTKENFTDAKYENPKWCKNDSLIVPKYYYFICRPWFIQNDEINKDLIYITDRYLYNDLSFGFSVCIKFIDPLDKNFDGDNYIIMCIDNNLNDYYNLLKNFNFMLSGSIYIVKVPSHIPLYYSSDNFTKGIETLENLVFNKNTKYFINEFLEFKESINKIIKKNKNNDETIYNSSYVRNNVTINYIVYPLLFLIDKQYIHFLSVVYETKETIYENILLQFTDYVLYKFIILSIMYVFIGGILILITCYLINGIAHNIINPIKNMTRVLKGIKSSIKEKEEFINLNSYENQKMEKNILSDDSSEMDNIDEDEDTNYIRSLEIDNLFNYLLKLKNALSFTSSKRTESEKSALYSYIDSKYIFKEVSNNKGYNLCDSNLGNLTMKFKKYDKAIIHLNESIKSFRTHQVSFEMIRNLGSIYFKKMTRCKTASMYKRKNYSNISINPYTKQLSLKRRENKINTVLIESRYPKLINSYKNFFSILLKILHSNQQFNEIFKNDIFIVKERHNITHWESILKEYLYESIQRKEKCRIVEGYLELNSFLIKYKLKPNILNNFNNELTQTFDNNCKEIYNFVCENFSLLDKFFEKMNKSKNDEYFKNFLLKMNVMKEDFDYIETNFFISYQRSNYLKGKLALYSGHYSKAFFLFLKSKEKLVISDASIIKSSIKKIYKILYYFIHKIDNQLISSKHLNKPKRSLDSSKIGQIHFKNQEITLIQKIRSLMVNYIDDLENELEFYSFFPKDLIFLIDNSDSMFLLDSKKMDRSKKVAQFIFENCIIEDDKFGLYFYSKYVNPIVSLDYKYIHNVDYVKDLILSLDNYIIENHLEKNSDLLNALSKIRIYFKKKRISNRMKWIIVLTDKLFINDTEDDEMVTLLNNFEEENINLIILGLNMSKRDVEYCKKRIKSKRKNVKFEFIENENELKLQSILRINGKIRKNEKLFKNEKYNSEKKNLI